MANPGYGKRVVPDQPPRRRHDFAHLPEREAYIAAYVDRLPDGAAMDVKTLAKSLPRYGQQAVRSALTALSAAGHLRRVREAVGGDQTRWVYRTYFSRTACDDTWWAHFLTADPPAPAPAPVEPAKPTVTPPPAASREVRAAEAPTTSSPEREPTPRARQPTASPPAADPPAPSDAHRAPTGPRSAAYEALGELGHKDARLTLSATDCATLEPLAATWLARGITKPQLVLALTAGLPDQIHAPGAFTRRRLIEKLPPEPLRAETTTPETPPPPRRLLECTTCAVPGRPEALPGGLCRTCRHEQPSAPGTGLPVHEVRRRVQELRRAFHARPADSVGTHG
ncbi:MarR family transcriptional regulator [Embleya sp. NBC_00896]|uniref:MarR family transcriptional regulator n=1 Tax=Embleya sp. NBC_00896 TaxID=2975961 RepID=UPI00386C8BCD|nr:MarR family transcriptional regulator [Embleya sp. NBC_00896]